ncbi:MAG: sigma-70 family RNA polymerase sigma factor [Flavobacteriales bacterium]|nr:sigma-70 family RNA polymerase sigma factor [Flavobacteriales bacterium]NNK80306.1 sigma-70 family RNA polymerase sigma factor [Flavobacteriales bacterium]
MEIANTNLSEKARYDYDLVQRAVANKDQQAYAELMGRYRDSIYFMLLKMVNNKDDADDLTIEAFGKAFSRLHQYTPNYAFSTWLFKIASNNAIDFIRKKKKKMLSLDNEYKNQDGDKLRFDVESDGRNPAEEAMYKQRVEHMHAIVQKLKPRYRQLVELRYFKEYSYDEISKELELPLGTVKAQLFRAREFLMNLMKDKRDQI